MLGSDAPLRGSIEFSLKGSGKGRFSKPKAQRRLVVDFGWPPTPGAKAHQQQSRPNNQAFVAVDTRDMGTSLATGMLNECNPWITTRTLQEAWESCTGSTVATIILLSELLVSSFFGRLGQGIIYYSLARVLGRVSWSWQKVGLAVD